MPRIQPYESQIGAQGGIPSQQASPEDAYGPGLTHLGQAVVQAGSNVGTVARIINANETRAAVTDVHTMLSRTRAEYTKKAYEAERQADPSQTDAWEQFYHGGDEDNPTEGSLKWYLDSYGQAITNPTAKQTFERGAADLSSQFGIHFAGVQSRMAGVHANNQAIKMIDAAQTAVQTDPSQYGAVLAQTMKAIDDPHSDYGRASFEDREKIKRMATGQIASSTVRGMIREDDPEHALHSLQSGEWDKELTGEQKIQLERAAETQIRVNEVEARRKEAEALRQQKALWESTDQAMGAKYALHEGHPGDAQFPALTATDIGTALQENRLDPAAARSWLNMIEEHSKSRTLKNDETISSELARRIWLDYGNPEKLTSLNAVRDAATKRQLTPARYNWLAEQFQQSKTEEGTRLGQSRQDVLNSFKTSITKSNPVMGKLDQDGDVLYGQFQVFATEEEERLRKRNEDPRTLYQRDHPNYLGKRVGEFQKPMMDSIRDVSKKLQGAPSITTPSTGGTPPEKQRKSGETPEQYLDRMKKK